MTPGDCLIAYTDGAIEARDVRGRMLGVQGLCRLIASRPSEVHSGWSEGLLKAVEAHRYGPPADDTLMIEISRPL
jgi:serine phosphatase RsbU (regulator of sigma subunit)